MSLRNLSKAQNIFFSVVAHLFLLLNKIRYRIVGYRSPRTFSVEEIKRALDYDYDVVHNWNNYLEMYLNAKYDFTNKNILELGPGADLGVGLIFLSEGARKYNALDVNALVKSAPNELYSALFKRMRESKVDDKRINYLIKQLEKCKENSLSMLNYVHSESFDVKIFSNDDVDLIVSNAAFEHFDKIDKTISEMSQVSRSGTILVTEIDLSTHTRWVRDVDPLNIYRLNESIYKLLHYSGIPNRIRPYQYIEMLSDEGWENIVCYPKTILDSKYVDSVNRSLSPEFRDAENEMQNLHVVICATKQ